VPVSVWMGVQIFTPIYFNTPFKSCFTKKKNYWVSYDPPLSDRTLRILSSVGLNLIFSYRCPFRLKTCWCHHEHLDIFYNYQWDFAVDLVYLEKVNVVEVN
jgi:hypothetical protein